MMTFSLDFTANDPEQDAIDAFKKDLRGKLNFPGAEQLTIRITKDDSGELSLQIDGPDIFVAEARKRLGLG